MASENRGEELLADGFFEGRLLMQIESWDASLSLAISSETIPPEYRFRGAFRYARGFDLRGRLLAPKERRDRELRVSIMPLAPDIVFDSEDGVEVGRFYFQSEGGQKRLSATLLLPEEDLAYAATCLGSIWKYLHIWISDPDEIDAHIISYSFSADLHPNLDAWTSED